MELARQPPTFELLRLDDSPQARRVATRRRKVDGNGGASGKGLREPEVDVA